MCMSELPSLRICIAIPFKVTGPIHQRDRLASPPLGNLNASVSRAGRLPLQLTEPPSFLRNANGLPNTWAPEGIPLLLLAHGFRCVSSREFGRREAGAVELSTECPPADVAIRTLRILGRELLYLVRR